MAKQWSARQQAVRDAEKRRVSAMMAGGARRRMAPPSEADVAKAIAAFHARGGEVQRLDPIGAETQDKGEGVERIG